MATIDYSTEGAGATGAAVGLGKAAERRLQQQTQQQMQLLEHQWDIEAFNRAKAWEIEKLEMKSRLDFEREEGDRQKRLLDINNKIDQLTKEQDAGRFMGNEPAFANAMAYWQTQKEAVESGISAPTIPWYTHPGLYETEAAEMRRQSLIAGQPKPPSRTDVAAAQKYLTSFREKEERAKRPLAIFAPDPTPEEVAGAEYMRSLMERAGVPVGGQSLGQSVGQSVEQGLRTPSQYPTPTTQAEYNALPAGSKYIDLQGNIRIKS